MTADRRYLVRLPDRDLYVSSGALEQCRRVGVTDATFTPWWVRNPNNAGRMTAAEATDVVCFYANHTPDVNVEVVPVPGVGTADFYRARPATVPAGTAAQLAAMVDAGDAWSVSVVPARRWPPPRRSR